MNGDLTMTFGKWVENQRLKGFLEHSLRLSDVEAAWNSAIEEERARCAGIVKKLAGADAVYPAGVEMLLEAIRNPSD